MQQANTWRSLQQGVGVPERLCSRTRTRRRRRKRSWGAPWACLLLVFLDRGTVWHSPALVLMAMLFRRQYGRPAERLCLLACGH
jgi:hypothetical protein